MWSHVYANLAALELHPWWVRFLFNLGVATLTLFLKLYLLWMFLPLHAVMRLVYRLWRNGWSWHPIPDDRLTR